MKAAELLKSFLLKANAYSSDMKSLVEKIKEIEGVNDIEFPDEIVKDAVGRLSDGISPDEIKKYVVQGRSEAYSKLDKSLSVFLDLMPEEDRKKIEELGEWKTLEKVEAALEAFRSRGDGNTKAAEDAKVFKKKVDEYNAKIESGELIPKTQLDEVSSKLTQFKSQIYNKDLLTAAAYHGGIADSVKGERWFTTQFPLDAQALMESKGIVYDIENNKFRSKDSEEYVLKDGTSEPYGINDLVSEIASTYSDYQKRSGGKANEATIETEGGSGGSEISDYQKAMAERANGRAYSEE